MSYGNKMSLPLSSPNFLAAVRSHTDYINKGYVWGQNGNVHYCFMNPKRVQFDLWEKAFHWSRLAWLLGNLAAAGLALWWGNVPLAVALFFAVPSLPLALLEHYRATARDQVAAVVTNGPQMQYPFGLTSAGIFAAGATVTAIGGVVAGVLSSNAGVIAAAGVKIAGITLSAGFVSALLGIGIGVNLGALAIFLLGYLTVPFGWVVTPTITDRRGALAGWYHLGRNAMPLATYRIAPNQPAGLRWGGGGLIPIIVNGMLTGFATSLEAVPSSPLIAWAQPAQVVIWGLLPLGDGAQPISDNFGSEITEVPDDAPAVDGMLCVVGSEQYTATIGLDLRRLGVKQAVATDGHLSPLLGTHGDLLISTYFALDPIQRYGLMATPE